MKYSEVVVLYFLQEWIVVLFIRGMDETIHSQDKRPEGYEPQPCRGEKLPPSVLLPYPFSFALYAFHNSEHPFGA